MTIHNSKKEKMTHSNYSSSQSNTQRPRHFRTMSTFNPFDYIRLLYWVLFRPNLVKVYRIRCTVPQRLAFTQQALWLVTFLLWGSLLLAIVVPMSMGALPVSRGVAIFMIVPILCAWVLTGRYGLDEKAQIPTRLILGNLLVAFGVVSLIAITLNQSSVSTLPMIIMSVIAIVCSLVAVSVAAVFRLKTAEKVAGIVAMVMGGGLSTLVFDLMEAAWIPVAIIIVAIFLVGVVEDRYDVSKHS